MDKETSNEGRKNVIFKQRKHNHHRVNWDGYFSKWIVMIF